MHRKKVFAAALTGLVIISGADIWLSHEVRKQRSALLDTVSSAREEMASLHDALGFGGLIHAFKNYVIRGDKAYYDVARTEAHVILIQIERLQSISRALDLDADLSAVRDTVIAYSDRLEIVEHGWSQGLSVREIDALVRVDDTPALEQLATLGSRIEGVNREGLESLSRLSAIQSVMTPLLQALMLALIILIWVRMYRNRLLAARDAKNQLRDLAASLKAQSLTLDRMKESHAALDNFTAMVAHDLKAPLRQASMLLHLSQRTQDSQALDEYATQVKDCIQRANTLVDSFLNLAQLHDQPPKTSLEDISDIFRQAAAETAILYRKAARSIEVEDMGEAYCDRDLIRQVAINLLTNALKYARPKTPLQIRVYAARDESQLTVYVEDNGVGIPPELVSNVFEPAVRGEAGNQPGSESRGLGLALCRTIIAAHGGEIGLSQAAGSSGTCIRFTLPLAQPEARVL